MDSGCTSTPDRPQSGRDRLVADLAQAAGKRDEQVQPGGRALYPDPDHPADPRVMRARDGRQPRLKNRAERTPLCFKVKGEALVRCGSGL
jgi:hypothetical protein